MHVELMVTINLINKIHGLLFFPSSFFEVFPSDQGLDEHDQRVMKEKPRRSPRVPPRSATREGLGNISDIFTLALIQVAVNQRRHSTKLAPFPLKKPSNQLTADV